MLHICPRIPGQAFAKLPFEEEILEFIRFLGHGEPIRTLTDININKLYQPWRSFAAIINKCLTGKSSGYDSLRFVHPKKKQDKLALCKGRFHILNDQGGIRHQNTQQYGAMLPIELTNDEIRNTKAYKEYYACATGEAAPKPKACARRKRSGSDTSITLPTAITTPTTTVDFTLRLTTAAKGKQPTKAKNEGTGSKPGVPDVPSDDSEEKLSWNSSDDEDTDAQEKDRDDDEGDKRDESDNGEEDDAKDKDGDERDDDDDDDQEIAKTDEQDDAERGGDDDEESESDEESDGDEIKEEESFDPIPRTPEDSEDDGNDEEDQGLRISEEERLNEEEDQESSSVLSQFVTSMLNPTSHAGMESIFVTASSPVAPLQTSTPIMTPSTIATITKISHALIPPTTIPSEILQNLPPFDLVFRFKDRLKSLEANFFEYIQTNPFAEAVSNISGIVHQYMNQQMTEAVRVSVNAQLEAEVLTRSSNSSRTSYAVVADLSEMEQKKILIEKMEGNKEDVKMMMIRKKDPSLDQTEGLRDREKVSASESAFAEEPVQTISKMDEPSYTVFETGADDQTIVQSSQHPEWFSQPKKPLTPDRDWNKTLPAGSCTSMIELEYHLEEVYKATTDQLDWVNPKGQQYPYNLLQPLPLIPDNQGRRVIPFAYFINNDLEYLRGGASSRKYTTSVTKMKATDYGNIKWIEDLVPRSMWIQELINYEKHALWGVSHWGQKHQHFYEFAVNRESALDVYSKRRIIAVMDLKIVEWHSYKYLDWITVRHEDDKLYKFKEGDFKRLRLQDIEDMLLILVQGKLSNLTQRVEDLQLGVESYKKRLNLTKADTYRSDLKRREAYTTYSNLRGFIYQNKDKKNRLMRIDKLHKFSDVTLNDVRNALDNRLKGIKMQYLPQTI
nr:hypothetical protein [Tanacetum cinerariifolium]